MDKPKGWLSLQEYDRLHHWADTEIAHWEEFKNMLEEQWKKQQIGFNN